MQPSGVLAELQRARETAVTNRQSPATLSDGIRNLYGCEATWLDSVRVKQQLTKGTVWEGTVHVFRLHGHAAATWCYAWTHASAGAMERGFVAILRQPPVDSAEAAVRAAYLKS